MVIKDGHKGIILEREGVVGGTVGSSTKGGGRRGNRRFLYKVPLLY